MAEPWKKYQQEGGPAAPGPWQKYSKPDASTAADDSGGSFFARGVARTLGAPVDLMTGIQSIFRDPGPQYGGSDHIMQMMEGAGVDIPDREPETLGETIASGTGEAAGALIPFGALARGAGAIQSGGRALTTAGNVGRDMISTAARRPVATMAGELTAGAGAGAGRYVGEQNFDSPAAKMGAELVGGVAGAAGPGAIAGAASRLPGVRAVRGAVAPFTEAGGRDRASRRVRETIEGTPEDVAAELRRPTDLDMDPATRTGDQGLMRLRRSVLDEEPTANKAAREQVEQSQADAAAAIREPGNGATLEDTRVFLERQREQATKALTDRMQAASARAQQRVADLAPERQRAEASVVVREEMEAAMRDARATERRLWQAVPQDVMVSTKASRDRFDALMSDLPRAQRDQMPEPARRFLESGGNDSFQEMETIKEMQGLRSRLLDDARKARAAGDFNQARISDDLADALLDDMTAPEAADVAPILSEARTFSRLLNQTFRQGAAGRVLGYTGEGGSKVAPELTLQATMGRGGEAGASQARQIMNTVDGSIPSARIQATSRGMEDYLRAQFADAAVKDGRLNLASARRFMSTNRETLDLFPGLKRAMMKARSAEAVSDIARQSADAGAKAMDAPGDAVRRFLGAPVEQEIATIAKAQNPTAAAAQLLARAKADPSGQAVRGLKAGLVDFLMSKATNNGSLSGKALADAINDPRTRRMIGPILTQAERDRLGRIVGELRKLDMARENAPSAGSVMDDAPNRIIDMIGRTIGARWGAKAGAGASGASLLTANFASQNVRRVLKRLTNDKAAELIKAAVTEDPDLLRALLMDVSTPAKARKAGQRLDAWLSGPGARLLQDEPEEE